jgi:AcrR family transcriptional regulator
MDEKAIRILKAARRRFERFGVKKTTMDEICRDVGISKKTLYEHFSSKEDLFVSTFIHEALKNRDLIMEKLQEVEDPLEKVQKLFRFGVNRQWKESFMIRVLQDEDGLYHFFLKNKYRLQVEEGVLSFMEDILKSGVELGKFRPMNTRTTAYFLFKLFQNITFAKTESIQGDEKDLEELIAFITAGIVKT